MSHVSECLAGGKSPNIWIDVAKHWPNAAQGGAWRGGVNSRTCIRSKVAKYRLRNAQGGHGVDESQAQRCVKGQDVVHLQGMGLVRHSRTAQAQPLHQVPQL